jgi:hypothetical protein
MGARVLVDGKLLGNITDQFLRYKFPLDKAAADDAPRTSTLSVVFDPKIDCGGRWMSCTGGWDVRRHRSPPLVFWAQFVLPRAC